MQFINKLVTLLSVFICLQAGAASIPGVRAAAPSFEDTTSSLTPAVASVPTTKKPGFFGKLKNKVLTLTLGKPAEGGSNTKKTLGWISILLFLLGLGLGAAGVGYGLLFLIPAGIVTGVISLTMKKDKNKPEERGSSIPGLIGIVLGVGLIIALVIGFSNWHD